MLFILILFNLEQTLYGKQSDIILQLSFELNLFTISFSTMNSVIIFPANKIERNLSVQSRKTFSWSEIIRFVALGSVLNWLNIRRFEFSRFSQWPWSFAMSEKSLIWRFVGPNQGEITPKNNFQKVYSKTSEHKWNY